MWPLLTPLKRYISVKDINTTNNVFKLHTKVTVSVLIFATILLSAKQYFGNPIDCLFSAGSVPKDTVDNWCWIMGAYVPRNMTLDQGRSIVMQRNGRPTYGEEDKLYLNWYQWVVVILATQAGSFFLPSLIWKVWESGRIKAICGDFASPLVLESWNEEKRKRIVDVFNGDYSFSHKLYAFRFLICEILNFIVAIMNILFINTLLSGFWKNYVPAVQALLSASWEDWRLSSAQTFPKWTKCDFNFVGPSGGEVKVDALCLMPLNIINEKIFAILWIWLLILVCASGINILYRLMVFCITPIRKLMMVAYFRPLPYKKAAKILRRCNFGDCFVLLQMGKNLNSIIYQEILRDLADSFEQEPESKNDRSSMYKRSSESITI